MVQAILVEYVVVEQLAIMMLLILLVCRSGSVRGCDYDGDYSASICGIKAVNHYDGADYTAGVCGNKAVSHYNGADYTAGLCGIKAVSHYDDDDDDDDSDTGGVCRSGSVDGFNYDGDYTASRNVLVIAVTYSTKPHIIPYKMLTAFVHIPRIPTSASLLRDYNLYDLGYCDNSRRGAANDLLIRFACKGIYSVELDKEDMQNINGGRWNNKLSVWFNILKK
ncbi:hypothetical protein RRG08_002356 [Elysia crispata]|uniref:Uncharacterized protein n=1 Tax=Elysia crispata TaxID=231223 RepID=A0AAE0ZUT7_9GAST|nr:hypothetical protein RRG08_002356 [Elysia crispata]